jgi:malate synthase
VFDGVLGGRPNQVDRLREDVTPNAAALVDLSGVGGAVTAAGLRTDVSVGVRYLESWLAGNGAAAIDNLMEDAATAEISRSQVWQWTHAGVRLADTGELVTAELVRSLLDELGFDGPARDLFEQVALADEFATFLTLPAYELID